MHSDKQEGRVRGMEKVDALIEALAEHIDLVESVIGIPVER